MTKKKSLSGKKKSSVFFVRGAAILVFSALVLTLSLAINTLFVEIKEKYIYSHKGKIVANLIYICFLVAALITGLLSLRLLNINVNIEDIVG